MDDSPSNPDSGVKVTFPSSSTVNVPSPGTVMVVCIPSVSGSRSMVGGSTRVSFSAMLNVTGVLAGVLVLSFSRFPI